MKKSTILLLVVVYVLSFFIIGLLGNSVRSYDPVYEPEAIELVDVEEKMTLKNDITKDGELYNYWYVYRGYTMGSVVRIKANVKPDNSTYPYVTFVKDAQNTSFVMETHATNENIEENFAMFSLNDEVVTPGAVVGAKFTVVSQNPGVPITISAYIVFACA